MASKRQSISLVGFFIHTLLVSGFLTVAILAARADFEGHYLAMAWLATCAYAAFIDLCLKIAGAGMYPRVLFGLGLTLLWLTLYTLVNVLAFGYNPGNFTIGRYVGAFVVVSLLYSSSHLFMCFTYTQFSRLSRGVLRQSHKNE